MLISSTSLFERPRDLRVRPRLVLHDLRRAQRVAPVHERHLGRELGQEHRLLHRRVAAADDGDFVAAEEVAVARRARGDAVAHQRSLGGQAQQPRRRAGRDDQRPASCTSASVGLDDERSRAQRSTDGDVALDDLGAEPFGLRAHLGHEIGPHDAVAVAGEILDDRGQHQLTAGFEPFDEERLTGWRAPRRGRRSVRPGQTR